MKNIVDLILSALFGFFAGCFVGGLVELIAWVVHP